MRTLIIIIFATTFLIGCSADVPLNPSFPLTVDDARDALRDMEDSPRELERPVIVLGGFHDPGLLPSQLARRLRRYTGSDEITWVAFAARRDFDDCRRRVIEDVETEFPSADQVWTQEVDVVAISMGGLVARHAAAENGNDSKRLRIARLFTISTPHIGADRAWLPTFDRCQLAMRHGSEFLASLNATMDDEPFEIIPYVRLDDWIVGAANTAPPGARPWWVANMPLEMAHVTAPGDPRILADIARRLRGEEPFTTEPAASLPASEEDESNSVLTASDAP